MEVVDTKLNYNILLGRSWTHAMLCVPSTVFRFIKFPHEGKIVTVDQLSFFTSTSENNVPYVDQILNPPTVWDLVSSKTRSSWVFFLHRHRTPLKST